MEIELTENFLAIVKVGLVEQLFDVVHKVSADE